MDLVMLKLPQHFYLPCVSRIDVHVALKVLFCDWSLQQHLAAKILAVI